MSVKDLYDVYFPDSIDFYYKYVIKSEISFALFYILVIELFDCGLDWYQLFGGCYIYILHMDFQFCTYLLASYLVWYRCLMRSLHLLG